ncbi:hypothetical protein M1B72_13920 [Geomonas paludis]|uniref:Peptidase MA-like domain-containing protein n=1 Tax=Geomonas paludis TaxID=2740185 RepID=A0A6V8N3X9_9BACT|nr:MXAN_6640 family putative metalloprotease [Geomonas paludis]UPU34542.1 hypothetical protein M1B72_13920 [Geomonas paludis]GFO65999.1 hypothetical protein GMPD_39180 [Geomonas paludis]
MGKFCKLLVALAILVLTSSQCVAASLDDYYLEAFGLKTDNILAKALLDVQSVGAKAVKCNTNLRHSLRRDWSKLESSTQTALKTVLETPPVLAAPASVISSGGHFRIHYSTTVAGAPDLAAINTYTGLNLVSYAAWASMVGDIFETVYNYYLQHGYHMPPASPYDVYMHTPTSSNRLVYGLTSDLNPVPSASYPHAFSSFIEVNKDFTASVFQPTIYTPVQNMEVTAAHEFHHAIQFGYNGYFDYWYAEMTSTWYEDEIFDDVNQAYEYLESYLLYDPQSVEPPPVDPHSVSLTAPRDGATEYARWIFNRSLAEEHNTIDVVRSIWETLAGVSPVNTSVDINMVPVIEASLNASPYNSTLATDFWTFVKKLYSRQWTTHLADLARISPPSMLGNYNTYPVPSHKVTLPRYSFAFYRFVPSSQSLTVTLSKTPGIQAMLFKKASGTVTEVPLDAGGTSYTVSDFAAMNPFTDEVVLLVANTTNTNSHEVSFSTDGSTSTVTDPTVTTGGGGGGGGGGCFIATAAYGSYLHPKVAELRAFRDHYLLTNAPGRIFVAAYYRLSPPIADVIARHEWMKSGVRCLLLPLILAVEHPAAALGLLLLVAGACLRWGVLFLKGRGREAAAA